MKTGPAALPVAEPIRARAVSARSAGHHVVAGAVPGNDKSIEAFTTDPARLAALDGYAVLDPPPEPAFDDAVELARQVCGTPIALVSFVDVHRQWFKARSGLGVSETPIEQSVCAHVLAHGALLVIPDLTRDERTKANTLVTGEPFIRFYAGAPLRTPAGAIWERCASSTRRSARWADARPGERSRGLGQNGHDGAGVACALHDRDDALSGSVSRATTRCDAWLTARRWARNCAATRLACAWRKKRAGSARSPSIWRRVSCASRARCAASSGSLGAMLTPWRMSRR